MTASAARLLGCVLAGGHSRRMGRDKALLPWGTSTLLEHALDLLRAAIGGPLAILCGAHARYAEYGLPLLLDEGTQLGPLAGLAAALAEGRRLGCERVLLLAVDLPGVTPDLLRHLAVAPLGGAQALVPCTAAGPEPLCAAYLPESLEAVRRALARDERRMTAFWQEARVARLQGSALAVFGEPEQLFANLNTPELYARLAGGRQAP